MSSIYNGNIKISLFGESHGPYIGVTIDGLKAGIKLDLEYIEEELLRKYPNNIFTTDRKEKDNFEIISGVFKGFTTGASVTFIIHNHDIKESNNDGALLRPGHADFTNHVHSLGFNDYRGGGFSSGRLMTPIVIAGAIAKQILNSHNINVSSHLASIASVNDIKPNYSLDELEYLKKNDTLSKEAYSKMIDACKIVKGDKDSAGGVVEAFAIGVDAGIGEPIFDGVESVVSSLMFSIPGVKAVEFGIGSKIANLRGSEANDAFYIENNIIKTKTNNNGGINGGITNGMPIVVKVSFKPTPSIKLAQDTVNIKTIENTTIEIDSRNDVCYALRSRVIVESMLAIAILDLYTRRFGYMWM